MILISKNPTLRQIADTAPKHWPRHPMGTVPHPDQPVYAICEEKGFENIPKKNCVAIFMDSVRQPTGKLQSLGVPVVTLDAPQPDCYFFWTPIDGSLFKPTPYEERTEIICPIRVDGYPYRQKMVETIRKMGVRIVERDDSARSYQEYIDDLCRAKAVVNFSADRKTGKDQLKGRVFETLAAGALLLEEKNNVTDHWLKRSEFFEWANLAELAAMIQSLKIIPFSAKLFAQRGHEGFRRFDAPKFWSRIERLI